jgi:3-hydroxymyristoyl/3-hydroxydecanoyl-(acyl carrier protein) dehydratase
VCSSDLKYEINKFWQEYLLRFFENMVIPKKWRYLKALPADVQGKKKLETIKALFSVTDPGITGFESVIVEDVIETTEASVAFKLSIPSLSGYFDGHFPEFSILPAVAQVELAVRLASRYLKIRGEISEIRRVKFSKLVLPDVSLILRLERKEGAVSFKIISPKDGTVYSSGAFMVRENR